jgi:hypothetical protein
MLARVVIGRPVAHFETGELDAVPFQKGTYAQEAEFAKSPSRRHGS